MRKAEKESQGKIAIIPAVWGLFEPTWQVFGFSTFSKLLTNYIMKTKSIIIIVATLIIGFIIGFLTNGQLTKSRIQSFVKRSPDRDLA